MENDNSYSIVLKKLPDEELLDYVSIPENYDADAVIAAVHELERRGILNEKMNDTLAMMEEKKRQESIIIQPVVTESIQESEMPVLYSKNAIRLFSLLFSTLIGGILMAINLARLKKTREMFFVLTFGMIFSYLTGMMVIFFPDYSSLTAISMNVLGLIILEGFFWKRMIGNLEYKYQSVWVALLIGFGIAMIILWAMMKQGA